MISIEPKPETELETAWRLREKLGAFRASEALRVFHGPGEGTGTLRSLAIDRFGDHYWITEWEKSAPLGALADFLRAHGAKSAVHLFRPAKGVPADPEILFGEPPQGRFLVREGDASYLIQCLGTKHPGLFLDHSPLRQWLRGAGKGAEAEAPGRGVRGLTVLNAFAYTGSLSVAAGLGGASQVTTLDLSKPVIEWARENWRANGLAESRGEFIFGDYFEWMQRLAKKKRLFECVILDPPSFSRGKKGSFSTAKDLLKLHELAFGALAPRGLLITSINSANITRKKLFYEIHSAARSCSRKLEILREIELPPTFPVRTPGSEEGRYLKGWILRCA